jgi:hypothetical protein
MSNGSIRSTSQPALHWVVSLLLVIVVLAGNPSHAFSQSDDWLPPVNLSMSGGATSPAIAVDNEGNQHVIWLDTFAGFMYTKSTEDGWTLPVVGNFPFSPPRTLSTARITALTIAEYPNPMLYTDLRGRIHAFWIDSRNILYHSSVNAVSFGNGGAWLGRRVIAESALSMSVAMDASGNFHIAYIRNLTSTYSPAGIYYRAINGTTLGLSQPVLLSQSPYFRSMLPEDANVSIATSWIDESEKIFVAWDNRPRNRISIIKSPDAGASWSEPQIVDGPEVNTSPVIPFNIRVGAYGSNVVMLWQVDQPGESCTQEYQWSEDGGETWSGRQRMLTNLPGCADDNQFLVGTYGQMLLMSKMFGQVYLLAWDNSRWSNPQIQTMLSSFIDEETYNLVDLRCQYASISNKEVLYVVGCDTGIGGDIWLTSRRFTNISTWFPTATTWSNPTTITESGEIAFSSSIASDDEGNAHLVWSQMEDPSATINGMTLQYARYDGKNWSLPLLVFGQPVLNVASPSITIFENRLYLTWVDRISGEIHFTSATADRATNPREWMPPKILPIPRQGGESPDIVVTSDGTIHVVYAIPINEYRGIYVVSSIDDGETWSDPVLVFDAVGSGFSMVSQPQIVAKDDDNLHLTFTRHSLSSNNQVTGLFQVQSDDAGESWTDARIISEGNITWSDVKVTKQGLIHILWQESGGGRHVLWHEYSRNNGRTWSNKGSAQNTMIRPELSSLLEDSNGQIHLLQISKDEKESLSLKHWVWKEPQWSVAEINELIVNSSQNASALLSTITTDNQIVTVYAVSLLNGTEESNRRTLFSTARAVNPSEVTQDQGEAPVSAEVIEPAVEASTVGVPENLETPMNEEALISEPVRPLIDDTPVDRNSQWEGLIIGIVAAFGAIFILLMLVIRNVRKRGME